MTTDTTRARPCPFCGHCGPLDYQDGSTYRWGVASCASCGASAGETRREYPDTGDWHKDAIAQWNSRAPVVLGGPIGYCHEIKWRAHQSEQVQKITRKAHPEYGYTQALYTAPQPTQAQACAAPLTDLEIESATGVKIGTPFFLVAKGFVKVTEAAHGIGETP